MADSTRSIIAAVVNETASDLDATWDSALNWAAMTDALVEIISEIDGQVSTDQFITLIMVAGMARRQSLQPAPESGVAS